MRLLPPGRVSWVSCRTAYPRLTEVLSKRKPKTRSEPKHSWHMVYFILGSILSSFWASLWVQMAKTEHDTEIHGNTRKGSDTSRILWHHTIVPAWGSPEVALSSRIPCATLLSSRTSIPPHFYQIALQFNHSSIISCRLTLRFNHTSTIQLALQLNHPSVNHLVVSHFNSTILR